MTITYFQAEKIRKTLQSLPELDAKDRPMNNKELVLFLKSTIAEKKKQGYTLERLDCIVVSAAACADWTDFQLN